MTKKKKVVKRGTTHTPGEMFELEVAYCTVMRHLAEVPDCADYSIGCHNCASHRLLEDLQSMYELCFRSIPLPNSKKK